MSVRRTYAWGDPSYDDSDDGISQRMRRQKREAEELKVPLKADRKDCGPGSCGCGYCLGYWMEPVRPILQQAPEQEVRNWAELVRRFLVQLTFNPKKLKRSSACAPSKPPGKGGHEACKLDTCG
jgi:hypothetical protein